MLFNWNKFKLLQNQYFSVIYVNLITLAYGAAIGWISPFLPMYLSDDTLLESGKLTIDEASWIGALYLIGGLIGTFLYGILSNNFGRKCSVFLLAFPNMISWILIIFARNPIYLYISQIMGGLSGGGLYVAIPLYIADIAEPRVRGRLGSIITIICNLGILIAFTLAVFLGPIIVAEIILAVPIAFAIGTLFIPETPQYLLQRDKIEKAEKSLKFYRNCKGDKSAQFYEEFNVLQINSKLKQANDQDRKACTGKQLFTLESFKAICTCFMLMSLNPLSGSLPLIIYSTTIFAESGSDYDPSVSSVVVSVFRLIGAYLSVIFIDKYGRKMLLIFSTAGNIIGLSIIGVFSYLYEHGHDLSSFEFVPIVSVSFAILACSMGILPVPYAMITEILPNNIRSIGTSLCIAFQTIVAFITLKIFPTILVSIHLYGWMSIFVTFTIFALVFIILVLPETKGKNLETQT